MTQERRRTHAGNEALAGVFADGCFVWLTDHGFTIDFLRSDPAAPPPGKEVLVARVAMSPKLTDELKDKLEASFAEYTRKRMPPEIYGDEEGESNDS